MRRKYAQTFPDRYYMFRCDIYQLGYFKSLYQKGHWSYVFSTVDSRIHLIVLAVIGITGFLGEYC